MYWYEDEVRHLEEIPRQGRKAYSILFYGSSSIRLWRSLASDFRAKTPVNLGFGGATLAACVWFFERIMADYTPEALVFYAGDNDLGDGRNPEEVYLFFLQLMVRVEARFGNIPCYFISLKPSLSRWNRADQFRYTNKLIESEIIKRSGNWSFIDIFNKMLDKSGKPDPLYYEQDGLHLSHLGYQLWQLAVHEKLR